MFGFECGIIIHTYSLCKLSNNLNVFKYCLHLDIATWNYYNMKAVLHLYSITLSNLPPTWHGNWTNTTPNTWCLKSKQSPIITLLACLILFMWGLWISYLIIRAIFYKFKSLLYKTVTRGGVEVRVPTVPNSRKLFLNLEHL